MNMRRVLPLLFVGLVALASSRTAFACVCVGEPGKRTQKEIKANTRGLSEDLYSLSDEFFEKLTFPRRQ
jgi:hypothetical protein